jgi:hypothetical protein
VKVSVWCTVSARITVPVLFNVTVNCEEYLHVERQHFQHLLWSVRCNYFIPKVIGRQACWFIGKIRMRLATIGALVAVEPVNKVKIPPCIYIYIYTYAFRIWGFHASEVHDSQVRSTVKYGHESLRTRNQERQCWREPTTTYPTLSEVLTAVVMKNPRSR